MTNPTTIKIDDVTYIREDSIQAPVESSTLLESCVGQKVIVRSRNEGINAGVVEAADETGIILKDSRRLWYHKPAQKEVSWYEGVAVSGVDSASKVSCTVPRKVIVEDYSITYCTDDAFDSIMEATPHAQN